MPACSLIGATDPPRKLPVSKLEVWAVGRSRRIWARQCWPTKKLSAWKEGTGWTKLYVRSQASLRNPLTGRVPSSEDGRVAQQARCRHRARALHRTK